MAFDWEKLSDVGFYLLDYSEDEEFQRSAVNRFYYAAFNLCKKYFENKYFVIGHINVHKNLIENLKKQNDFKDRNLGKKLQSLRRFRVSADYHNNRFNQNNTKKSIKLLEDIIEILKDLK